MKTLKRVCAYIVWMWVAAALLHGAAHLAAGAPLTPLPPSLLGVSVTVEVFFSLGPLVALLLLSTRWIRLGALLLFLSMLTGLLWGFGGHYLFASGDNVLQVTGPAAPAFLISSILVFIVPWAGITAAIYTFMQALRQPYGRGAVGAEQQQREQESHVHAGSQ